MSDNTIANGRAAACSGWRNPQMPAVRFLPTRSPGFCHGVLPRPKQRHAQSLTACRANRPGRPGGVDTMGRIGSGAELSAHQTGRRRHGYFMAPACRHLSRATRQRPRPRRQPGCHRVGQVGVSGRRRRHPDYDHRGRDPDRLRRRRSRRAGGSLLNSSKARPASVSERCFRWRSFSEDGLRSTVLWIVLHWPANMATLP